MKTSIPTIARNPTQIPTYVPIPGSCSDAPDAIMQPSPSSGSVRVHQIHQRKYEHPHDVHEMPIEAGSLHVVRVQPASVVTPSDYGKRYYAGRDMQQVKTRDAEERGA